MDKDKSKTKKKETKNPFSVFGAVGVIKERKKKNCASMGMSWDNQTGRCK